MSISGEAAYELVVGNSSIDKVAQHSSCFVALNPVDHPHLPGLAEEFRLSQSALNHEVSDAAQSFFV
jgi:hypothetical protein